MDVAPICHLDNISQSSVASRGDECMDDQDMDESFGPVIVSDEDFEPDKAMEEEMVV